LVRFGFGIRNDRDCYSWIGDGFSSIAQAMASNSGDADRADPANFVFVGGKNVMQLKPKNPSQASPLELAGEITATLLRKHGGKTGEELKAEGK